MPSPLSPPLPAGGISQVPDAHGRFGRFGGRYVPETLSAALDQLQAAYDEARADPAFQAELDQLLAAFVGRPLPLLFAKRLTAYAGGAQIWFKREDLSHTGAHKINNTLGQGLLAMRMGKKRIIAETGAGQHGVATATACARFGLDCVVYMGAEDVRRQEPNVRSMRMMGAEVRPVESGSRTLRDAINEAMRDWMGSVETTHYIIGSVVGPHPFPRITRDFQSVIGQETLVFCQQELGRDPDCVVACVGGGAMPRACSIPWSNTRGSALSASRRVADRPSLATMPRAFPTAMPASFMGASPTYSRIPTAKRPTSIRCRRGSTIPASAPSMLGGTTRSASNTRASPMPRPSTPSISSLAVRGSSPPSRHRMPSLGR